MNFRPLRGFSLIELMIAITILSLLTMLAMPSFSRWIANTQVRTMAESVQNGLRLAQREAAARNGSVTFRFTGVQFTTATPAACNLTLATSGTNWVVCPGNAASTAKPIQQSNGKSGSAGARVSSGFSSITFDGLGRTDKVAPQTISVTSASGACESDTPPGVFRCLNVLISPGGKVRLCDPSLDSGNPSACS